APIESLVTTSTGIASSFSSQEPRRPRFSFFFLHNVKELTFTPQGPNVGEATASDFYLGKTNAPSGRPAASLPCQISLISGNNITSFASSASRFLSQSKRTVNTVFRKFSSADFSMSLNFRNLFRFQRLASVPAAVWRRALQR
ncbi:hypothetical protein, partial [Devosia soli]|uniref:hypothetical protein n=1 Tax=Devosia soli TaxID=361041 RepID=UPI001AEBB871